ncbi:DUF624 domain-containing protein [Microbacterium sp. W1N]|uniref:DUF624 domain-containing protein n=1 Tax=Microbacterium festucae TaxID=2977531 RepID=UPI0021BF7317|nr:DUF624 domain-containing protein [Microbacterium festucae]MCT9821320.1 DUF624 domain-containing protein [Microbacterium festucae]
MKRVTHSTWASILGVLYLGLMVNMLVAAASLPLVVLLLTTDPMVSWPLLAVAAPVAGPAFAAAFATFRAHADGEPSVIGTYVAAWKRVFVKALAIAAAATAVLVVLLVDVRMLSDTALSVVIVPVLLVLSVATVATALVALVALSEVPGARLREILRASLYLAVRRWVFTLVSLVVIAMQVALFTQTPAFALGLTAAPALYVAWANARYILRPVLGTPEIATA